eukprot:4495173-Prymnesium_polylepis.1
MPTGPVPTTACMGSGAGGVVRHGPAIYRVWPVKGDGAGRCGGQRVRGGVVPAAALASAAPTAPPPRLCALYLSNI